MIAPTLFDPGPPDTPPGDDAAPLAGGAGVSAPNGSPEFTRLPLTPPATRREDLVHPPAAAGQRDPDAGAGGRL